MFQRETQKIIKSISLDLHIPEKYIEEIVKSQFQFTNDVIRTSNREDRKSYKTIKLLNFVKFVPNQRQLYILVDKPKLKDENNIKQNLQRGEE